MRAKEQQVSDNRGDNGRDPLDQNFRKFRYKIKWNRKFLETCFEKFQKIGILGKSRSIRQFLPWPSYSRPGNRQSSTCRKLQLLNSISISARLVFLRLRPKRSRREAFPPCREVHVSSFHTSIIRIISSDADHTFRKVLATSCIVS